MFLKNLKRLTLLVMGLLMAFVVVGCGNTDNILETAKNRIMLSGEIKNLTNDLTLPGKVVVQDEDGEDVEIEISWTSTQSDYFAIENEADEDGNLNAKVTRPEAGEEQAKVTLTATIELDGKTAQRVWTVYVKPLPVARVVDVEGGINAMLNEYIEVTAEVSYLTSQGFYLQDGNKGLYVYLKATPADNIKPGAEVKVVGMRGTYYNQPQIVEPTATVVTEAPTEGFDYSVAVDANLKDIVEASNEKVENFSILVNVTGLVIKDYKTNEGKEISDYALKDVVSNSILGINNSSDAAVLDELKDKVGSYVTVTVIVQEFRTDLLAWRALGVAGTVVDAEAPVLTDEEMVDSTIAELEDTFTEEMLVNGDIDLYTSNDFEGLTISWETTPEGVISTSGKFTAPDEDTDVTLTATITKGEVSKNFSVVVKAVALEIQSVSDVIDQLGTNDLVAIEGIVVGFDSSGYFYIADEESMLYVRAKNSELQVGDKVNVVGPASVYTGKSSAEYTRQINGGTVTILSSGNELPIEPTVVELDDIKGYADLATVEEKVDAVKADPLYGKLLKVTGVLKEIEKGGFKNLYITSGDVEVVIHHYSKAQDLLKDYLGKEVTLIGTLYGHTHDEIGWRFGFMGEEGHFIIDLTEAEKLEIIDAEVEAILGTKDNVTLDLNFITEKAYPFGVVRFEWTSSNTDVIGADGKVNIPDEDALVTVTTKVYFDDATKSAKTYTNELTVKAIVEGTVLYTLDFEDATQNTSYVSTPTEFEFNGQKWTVFRGNFDKGTEGDRKNGQFAIRMKAESKVVPTLEMNFDLVNVSHFTMLASHFNRHEDARYNVYKSSDGGANWSQIATDVNPYRYDTTEKITDLTPSLIQYDLNETGNVRIKIEVKCDSTATLNFDDIKFYSN